MAYEIEATYTDALERLDADISEMKAGRFRHYREGPDGRLNVDDTGRMIEVAQAERKLLVSSALRSH
ncbi:hypothetical protein [Agrobacterium pusense]|uniref:hypothetical protein n=1 Tax=Agrobacterium pusense TaxID=648995 RepID=UPI001C6EDE7D|nr:hypothetical protein [Agrobacterium pusense]MBW9059169.1 hypothetical protein [Agrobacterium pusense]